MEISYKDKTIKLDFGDIYEYEKLKHAHDGYFTVSDYVDSSLTLEGIFTFEEIKTSNYKVTGPGNLENNKNKLKMDKFIEEVKEAIK